MPMPSKKQAGLSLENAVFYISLVILVATVGTFFYLQNSVSKTGDELASLTFEAAKLKTEDEKNLENSILKTQQMLKDFSKALTVQKASSEILKRLEEMVILGVYLTKCEIETDKMAASISGHAKNFEVLGQQITNFESNSEVLGEVIMGSVKMNPEDGGIDFEVKVMFNEGTATPKYGG